jgi:hypothetical protein
MGSLSAFTNSTYSTAPAGHPRSISRVLGVHKQETATQHKLFPDIRRVHQVLICSNTFGSHETLGPFGNQTCLKRVPISSSFGEISVYSEYNAHDYIECEGQTLSRLHFRLADVEGHSVELNGLSTSFTILFD